MSQDPRKTYTAIGLMSGTSLDGVDAALLETDGRDVVKPLDFLTIPYEPAVRAEIRMAFGLKDRGDPRVLRAEALVTDAHIAAVEALLCKTGRTAESVDLVGFHGQTIFHAPADGLTVQIGDGARMAKTLGIDVVDDFRSADVRAGGEGAPLIPLYHAARIRGAGLEKPVAVLNIGGVANVTWIGEGPDDIVAFDTGPGNAMMDDWAFARAQKRYDEDGRMAASGTVRAEVLKQWLAHPYFTRKPPKSLDRDQWDIKAFGPLAQALAEASDADGAATLLAFTAEAIAASVAHMPQPPKCWYACGGGRHNKALMKTLSARLAQAGHGDLRRVDDLGWDGDAMEAEGFAYLAVRSLLGEVLSLPGTTGVPEPLSGGVLRRAG